MYVCMIAPEKNGTAKTKLTMTGVNIAATTAIITSKPST